MTFFTQEDVDGFKDLVEEASPDTAIISRNGGVGGTLVPDGFGGSVDNFVNIGTLMVKVSSLGQPTETVAGMQLQGVSDSMVTVPTGTDVRNGDRILTSSQNLEVVGVDTRRSFEARRRVYTKAIGARP